jgi:DNA primase
MNEIEEVKARLDIVEVVGGYLQLQKAGRTFKAPCPFHQEKTPSFIVTPDRQTWHCFGACSTGGDVITFVMKREGLEFPEALRMLAERAGVKLPERRVSEEQDKTRQRLYAANEAALEYFRSLLKTSAGREALLYVERRGIDEGTATRFGLGYSLPGWEAGLEHLRSNGFSDREIAAAGLAVQGDRGLHDRFRGRLMFPVWDAKGRVIGFGARALDDSMPKYLNTAQTSLFDKGGTLYALDRAGEAIRREGRAVVVEGYMDVIAAHQFGFENVVAQMGTALTERQVRLLKRLTGQVVLALDADAAGLEAAVRGHDVVREAATEDETTVNWAGLVRHQETASIDLRVAVLPEGHDPDDYLRTDPEQWRALIEGAEPVLDFRLNRAAASRDLTDPRARSSLVQEFLPLLRAVADRVVRAHYIQRLARLALTSEDEISGLFQSGQRAQPSRPAPLGPRRAAADQREDFLLALLLRYDHLRDAALGIDPELLWEAPARRILTEYCENGPDFVKKGVELELKSYVERLILWRLPISGPEEATEALEDCVGKLKQRRLQAEKQAIAAQIADLQDQLAPGATDESDANAPAREQLQQLLLRDMEIGRQLHARPRLSELDRGTEAQAVEEPVA